MMIITKIIMIILLYNFHYHHNHLHPWAKIRLGNIGELSRVLFGQTRHLYPVSTQPTKHTTNHPCGQFFALSQFRSQCFELILVGSHGSLPILCICPVQVQVDPNGCWLHHLTSPFLHCLSLNLRASIFLSCLPHVFPFFSRSSGCSWINPLDKAAAREARP